MGLMDQLEQRVLGQRPGRMAVVAAHDEAVLASLKPVHELGLIQPTLIGDKEEIFRIADQIGFKVDGLNIIKELDNRSSAELAVNLVVSGDADIIMKGNLQTADLLKAVLEKDKGLRTGNLISHCGLYEVPGYSRLLLVTDAGINIAPDLKQKTQIIRNAVSVMNAIGVEQPKVAAVAAVELVNPSMQATLDAAALAKMSQRGQLGNCLVDGPLGMDNAISLEAAKHKNINSEVAGAADIILVPDIETGNVLVKSMVFLFKVRSCGVIAGAKVPLVVTSRAESSDTKYNSILLALAMMHSQQP
jgi:phosphate butyryltransferase